MKAKPYLPISLLLFGILCSIEDGDAKRIRIRKYAPRNFASVRINAYGEKELRIAHGRILMFETSANLSERLDLVIRQLTDGKRFVQGVFQEGLLKDCDYNQDVDKILEFVEDFIGTDILSQHEQFGDVYSAYHEPGVQKNSTVAFRYFHKHDKDYLKDLMKLLDLKSLVKNCHMFARSMKHIAKEKSRHEKDGDIILVDGDIKPGFVAPNDTGHRIGKRSLGTYESVKKSRSKRSTLDFNSVLIFPGTKWCGKGDLATCYEDLGTDETDVCCRDHDCCPYIIPPFTSRYNTLNYRFYSLIHCDCDNRFRGCLQESLSTTANMIGKIYFNVLGSKCFTFEEKDICMERTWWGKCRRYEKVDKAIVQSQSSFEHKRLKSKVKNSRPEIAKTTPLEVPEMT